MDRYFADTYDANGKSYVFDQHDAGQQVGDSFPTIQAAEAEAERLNEREALRQEARQEALLDAAPILAEHRSLKGEV